MDVRVDRKESRVLKHWCFWALVLEKTLESPLDCKEIKSVNPKWNQSWIFIGRTDAEAEALTLCSPYVKSQLIKKNPDAGKDRSQEEKGTKKKEVVGWHHWLNGREFDQALGDGDGPGSLVFAVRGVTELNTTERLNHNNPPSYLKEKPGIAFSLFSLYSTDASPKYF